MSTVMSLLARGIREPVSFGTHFLACLAAVWSQGLFWRSRVGGPRRRASLLCFGASMALLFAASAAYHGLVVSPAHQHLLKLLDHSAIYLLIAGSYTPAFYVLLPSSQVRRAALGGIWAMAAAGIACKWLVAEPPYWLVVGPYIGFGWVGVGFFPRFRRAVGLRSLGWVIAGGLAYTIGALVDCLELTCAPALGFGPHETFHLCVMAGAMCHTVFMLWTVAPYPEPRELADSFDTPESLLAVAELDRAT